MLRKTVNLNANGIGKLPDDKPVVYKILKGGTNMYTGTAKRGQVRQRISDHLPGGRDPVPGSKVQIEQMTSINEAQDKERRIISRSRPRYNKRGK